MPKIIHIIFLQIFQSVVNASLFLFFKPVARRKEPIMVISHTQYHFYCISSTPHSQADFHRPASLRHRSRYSIFSVSEFGYFRLNP